MIQLTDLQPILDTHRQYCVFQLIQAEFCESALLIDFAVLAQTKNAERSVLGNFSDFCCPNFIFLQTIFRFQLMNPIVIQCFQYYFIAPFSLGLKQLDKYLINLF